MTLDLELESYDQLHDFGLPFPAAVRISSGQTVVQSTGTSTDPLAMDGMQGHLSLVAPSPGSSPGPPLRLAGAFRHEKELWKLEHAKGAVGEAAVEDGSLQWLEGSMAEKTLDKIDVGLRFGQVDLDRLMRAFANGGSTAGGDDYLPEVMPDPQVTARLEVRR